MGLPVILLTAFAIAAVTGPVKGQQSPQAGDTMDFAQSIAASLEKLQENQGLGPDQKAIVVSVAQQRLFIVSDSTILQSYPVSTSKYGIGNQYGSKRTPPGTHRIQDMIGSGAPAGMIFKERRPTGRMAEILTDGTDTPLDLVTTRIMWLGGLEPRVNKGGRVDSHDRYIYIHGTPEEGLIGTPQSNGCIRMKNADVIALFDQVSEGTLVEIQVDEK